MLFSCADGREYVAIEQRHTYFRPRHGADFGPQIAINEDVKEYCRRAHLTLIAYSILAQGAYTRPDRAVPAQYAGPDADDRLEVLKAVAKEAGATLNQVIIAWMLRERSAGAADHRGQPAGAGGGEPRGAERCAH